MSTSNLPISKRIISQLSSWLIRAYKGFGLIMLAGILLGLIGFLTINLFYLFNDTWIRPIILSPSHERVVLEQTTLAKETHARDQLISNRAQLQAELKALERTRVVNREFEAEYDRLSKGAATDLNSLMLRREVDRSMLERERADAREKAILNEIEMLDKSIADYERVIDQIRSSPYISAAEREITVAFVPYENLDNIRKGAGIYGCKWGLVRCSKIGRVVSRLKGEVINTHPHDNSELRGIMVEIELTASWAAQERALFVGSRPFWIF